MKELKARSRVLTAAWRCVAVAGIAALLAGLFATQARAQDVKTYSRDTYIDWLAKYKDAKPDFKPGDTLTAKDLERIRPFMWPGYFEQLNFPEFRMPIIATVSHMPRKDFMDCTEKYQNQVRLTSELALSNYVCGQPFPDAVLKPEDPMTGVKAAWNFNWRWQNFGFFVTNAPATWCRFGGDHADYNPEYGPPPMDWTSGLQFKFYTPQNPKELYGGGGTFQRTLQAFYQKVYFSHLAPLQDTSAGIMPIPGAKDFESKEFTGFFAPFDIRGTAFIIFRYVDPFRADDAWAYIPNLRRVRRISAEVKSDSLLGTDHTLEDFYSFSGRPLEWKWNLLAWKDVLAVQDSKYDYTHLYGPNGMVPNDVWSLRRFAIVERTPKDVRHPYKSEIMMWDAENWDAWLAVAFDRKGKLWKLWEYQKKWTETFNDYADINHGVQTTNFQSVQVMDVQNSRGTIWLVFGGYPSIPAAYAEHLYDINKLEQIHR